MSRTVFELLCVGDYFPPSTVLPPFTKEDWKRGLPEDGDVLDMDFESLNRRK